jgi:hypothetical protein
MNSRKLALAALCTMTGALLCSAPAALATLQHPYLSQLTGTPTGPSGESLPFSESLCGVTVDPASQNVYVADPGNDAIDIFSSSGAYQSSITGLGIPTGPFSSNACSTAVSDITGDVYVADSGPEVVYVFNAMGTYLETIKVSGAEYVDVAVDQATGDIYIANFHEGVVDRFNSKNEYEPGSQLTGLSKPRGLATDSSGDLYVADSADAGSDEGGTVQEFNFSGSRIAQITGTPTVPLGNLRSVAVDSSGNIYVADASDGVVEEFNSSGTFIGQTAAPGGPFPQGVAVNAAGDLYVADRSSPEGVVDIFGSNLVVVPDVGIEAAKRVSPIGAQLNGSVNPDETSVTACQFEYGTETTYGSSVPCSPVTPSGASAVPVSAELSGLERSTTYHYRLVASNTNGASYSHDGEFTTLASYPPVVSIGAITALAQNSATLSGDVNPNEGNTTYRFEDSTDGANWTSLGGASIAANAGEVPVTQNVTTLAGHTTYHVRLVALNEGGTSTSGETTFTTPGPAQPQLPVSAGCPNEQVRSESDVDPETGVPFSLQLPECRAYEMVSPPLKNGASATSSVASTLGFSASKVERMGLEGSTVLIASTGVWPGAEQPANSDLTSTDGEEAVRYRVTRGESGWGFKPEVPPASDLRAYLPFVVPDAADLGLNGIWTGAGFAPGESNSNISIAGKTNQQGNLYLLEPDGALAEIGPSVPLSDRGINTDAEGVIAGNVESPGASADLSRVLLRVVAFRWPFDQTKRGRLQAGDAISSLYEYAGTGHTGEGGDVPTLVGVDNTGALISQCGTEAGGISSGGSTVFFTAQAADAECAAASSTGAGTGPVVNQLFARVGEPGKGAEVGSAVTVNVAGTLECATGSFDSCNVTSAVKYQGASTDGSKVFFTSEQPELVAGDTDSTDNLYECRLPGDSGTPLIPVSPVNPCPDLVRVSVPVSGPSAGVQSVAAVSHDGSHVYFIATGVLSGENAEHNSPTEGQDNLYVWQEPSATYPQGHTAFIATLPSAALGASEGEGGQVTPDGDAFVFTSSADLTPDDTSTVNQVFLYEAQHEALIRVSKGQDAFNNDGNTTTSPATIATGAERKTISADGSTVVFQSSDALTPQVHGGTRDVYLWRGGNVSLISDGTPASENSRKDTNSVAEAGLVGIDASGRNVFFTTAAQLVGQDGDELSDLYDARVDGGFPAPKVTGCSGEACQGAPSPSPSPLSPGSLFAGGSGNLAPQVKAALPPKPKSLTRAQKLAKALKACEKDKSKENRAKCKSAAHKLYGARAKAKGKPPAKPKTRKSSRKGDK